MQARMVIFIVLSLGAWLLLNRYYGTMYGPEGGRDRLETDVSAPLKTPSAVARRPRIGANSEAWTPGSGSDAGEKQIEVSTKLYRAVFSSRGGRLLSFQVNKYRDPESGRLEELTGESDNTGYLLLEGTGIKDEEINYSVDGPRLVTVAEGEEERLVFYHRSSGGELRKEYVFHGGRYVIGVDVVLRGKSAASESVVLTWAPDLGKMVSSRYGDEMKTVLLQGGKVTEKKLKGKNREEISGGAVNWLALKKRYFVIALRAQETLGYSFIYEPAEKEGKGARYSVKLEGAALPQGRGKQASFLVYLGPLDYYRMSAAGHEMQRVVTFGFFNALGVIMLKSLHFFYKHVESWGLAIILLSLLIKVVLWWPTGKSQKAMRRMQETMKIVQPKINAMKKKYKDDPNRMNQEQMKLFKEHKINPMGGCLPMLLQLPVFWALYTTLANAIELRGVSFLWMDNLAGSDPLYILPVLMGASSFLQQKFSGSAATATGQQKMMMYFFPLFLMVISVYWPAGLLLYWVVSNVLYICQIYWINKTWKKGSLEPQAG